MTSTSTSTSTSTTIPEKDSSTVPEKDALILESTISPFTIISEEDRFDPKELSKDEAEAEAINLLSNIGLDSVPTHTLLKITADEIFGDEIDKDGESLFLAKIVDETQPLQSELIARLSTLFDENGFNEPDRYSFQVFKRKAGFTVNDKRLPKCDSDSDSDSDPDLTDLGQYCVAVCLRDYQIVKFNNNEYLITANTVNSVTPVFELEPHPKGKKAKPSPRPSVPKNRTQIKLGQGRATIKPRDYMSILIWAFWDANPIKENEIKTDTSRLQGLVDKLKTTAGNCESHPTESVASEEITVYNNLGEASKASNGESVNIDKGDLTQVQVTLDKNGSLLQFDDEK